MSGPSSPMEIRHGGLVVDVPQDWQDRSTLLFVGPAPRPSVPAANVGLASTRAVAVRFTLDGSKDAQTLVRDEVARLHGPESAAKILTEEAFTCPLGSGWIIEHEFRLAGIVLRQLDACVPVGPIRVLASASTHAVDAEAGRPILLAVLRSMRTTP